MEAYLYILYYSINLRKSKESIDEKRGTPKIV